MDSEQTLAYSRPARRRGDERLADADPGGLLLGRYRLLEHLGSGGFATVYRAHDERLDREVALKRILLPDERDTDRAMREARATARLSHPAIVALLEAHAGPGEFYLVSELVEGHTLKELITEDALADEEILEIGLALAEALEHAHARGVIHRDVKPQNVLVPDDPDEASVPAVAKLADFGGASLIGDDALTLTGDVLGTLAYMAPEQSEGLRAGPEADLYSLALVLYESFSGVNPVRGATPAETARRLGEPIESLARHRRDLPRSLSQALERALDPEPARRGTVGGLRRSLEVACAELRDPPRSAVSVLRPAAASGQLGVPRPRREASAERRDRARWYELPRICWWSGALGLIGWQLIAGHAGVALLLLAAAIPLIALPRRSSPALLTGALAPLLGLIGLAGAYPAASAQPSRWLSRACLGARGYWWLVLAEPLSHRRLWLGPPQPIPTRAAWEGSVQVSAVHVVYPLLTVGVALGCLLWASASTILPWIVRGHSAVRDTLIAAAWATAMAGGELWLKHSSTAHSPVADPRGLVASAIVCGMLAVGARAIRAPL